MLAAVGGAALLFVVFGLLGRSVGRADRAACPGCTGCEVGRCDLEKGLPDART